MPAIGGGSEAGGDRVNQRFKKKAEWGCVYFCWGGKAGPRGGDSGAGPLVPHVRAHLHGAHPTSFPLSRSEQG
jgi:hypothetical protein